MLTNRPKGGYKMKQNRMDVITSHEEFNEFKEEFNLKDTHIDYIIKDDVIKINTNCLHNDTLEVLQDNITNIELTYYTC